MYHVRDDPVMDYLQGIVTTPFIPRVWKFTLFQNSSLVFRVVKFVKMLDSWILKDCILGPVYIEVGDPGKVRQPFQVGWKN